MGTSVVKKAGPEGKVANVVGEDTVPSSVACISSENGVTPKEVGISTVDSLGTGIAVTIVKAGFVGADIVVMGEVMKAVGLSLWDVAFNVTAEVSRIAGIPVEDKGFVLCAFVPAADSVGITGMPVNKNSFFTVFLYNERKKSSIYFIIECPFKYQLTNF